MPRAVPEWVGKTDDSAVPGRVKDRILRRQTDLCAGAACTVTFSGAEKPEFDHIVPLILGGQNRERNLQALCRSCHGAKSQVDVRVKAKVASVRAKHLGLKAPPRNLIAGSRSSKWKRRVDGTTVPRNAD